MTKKRDKNAKRQVYNRLRDLRKKDLGIKSAGLLAEMLGGLPDWYDQRVQRLESGETALTDEVAAEIAQKLNVPLYSLFIEPITYTDARDKEIISRYHALKPEVRKVVDGILFPKDD